MPDRRGLSGPDRPAPEKRRRYGDVTGGQIGPGQPFHQKHRRDFAHVQRGLAGIFYLLITVPLAHLVNTIDNRLRKGRRLMPQSWPIAGVIHWPYAAGGQEKRSHDGWRRGLRPMAQRSHNGLAAAQVDVIGA